MKVSVNILIILTMLFSVASSITLILLFHPTTLYEVLRLAVLGMLSSIISGLIATFLTKD